MLSPRPSRRRLPRIGAIPAVAALAAVALVAPAGATPAPIHFVPGALLVSTSNYVAPDIVAGVTQLPPGCSGTACVTATAGPEYPQVFNNDLADGSFGITSPIVLEEISPDDGSVVGTYEVPNSGQAGIGASSDQLVTSFSSKSELSLNQSTDGSQITFMGYNAPVGALDVSNSNTPGAVDKTNPVPGSYYRAVAQLGTGGLQFTETNAYSGNNGRAAVLNSADNLLYMAGNAGNGSNPQPAPIVEGAGAQMATPSTLAEPAQTPGTPQTVGSFNITQTGVTKPDKVGKDDNFRGIGIYNNVLYFTKGSGGNGINTLYFVDPTGTACPAGSGGTGLPVAGASLPTTPLPIPPNVTGTGFASNMCVLKGFPTQLAKNDTTMFPFAFFFASPTTLYLTDEGAGDNTFAGGSYTNAAASTTAGLQKWVFNADAGEWQLAYTLQSGLNLGTPYTVAGYPAGTNPATGLPWSPATDGLRNLAGRVNRDGTVTLYAITSTISGSGDQGADPNKLVTITDSLGAMSLPTSEGFTTMQTAHNEQVLRGVSLTPGSCPTKPGRCTKP